MYPPPHSGDPVGEPVAPPYEPAPPMAPYGGPATPAAWGGPAPGYPPQPGYGFAPGYPPQPPKTPGTVIALRIIAWVQVGFLLIGALFGFLAAALGATSVGSSDEFASGFGAVFLIFGAVFGFIMLACAAAVGVPTLLIKASRYGRNTAPLITLCVFEGIFALLVLLAAASNATSVDPGTFVGLFVYLSTPAAILVLGLLPTTLAWARGAVRTH